MDLAEFLLARITEDRVLATLRKWHTEECDTLPRFGSDYTYPCDCGVPERLMAECEAKQRIVEDFEILHRDYRETHSPTTEARRFQARVAMAQLALPYADHPDYQPEWKP